MAKTSAQRQAEFMVRQRALTPMQRELRLDEEELYTSEERELLARFRIAQGETEDIARRLNELVSGRLHAIVSDPETPMGARLTATKGLLAVQKDWRLTLDGF